MLPAARSTTAVLRRHEMATAVTCTAAIATSSHFTTPMGHAVLVLLSLQASSLYCVANGQWVTMVCAVQHAGPAMTNASGGLPRASGTQ